MSAVLKPHPLPSGSRGADPGLAGQRWAGCPLSRAADAEKGPGLRPPFPASIRVVALDPASSKRERGRPSQHQVPVPGGRRRGSTVAGSYICLSSCGLAASVPRSELHPVWLAGRLAVHLSIGSLPPVPLPMATLIPRRSHPPRRGLRAETLRQDLVRSETWDQLTLRGRGAAGQSPMEADGKPDASPRSAHPRPSAGPEARGLPSTQPSPGRGDRSWSPRGDRGE